ncbi:MAG: fibronectin type III domain-containing protein, partial [Bacteroidales bacterium]|nr:fibronectin type III domain-containing protein [Bacteroidales bacterium]
CLYFGTEDAISASSNPDVDINGLGVFKDFVYLGFYNGTFDDKWGTATAHITPVYAGNNATAKYEIVGDTLFVGYENLKVYSLENATTMPLSFQYKITPDGVITLIPVAMQPTGATDKATGANFFFFTLGLIPGGDRSDGVFLRDLNGNVMNVQSWAGIPKVEIADNDYPSVSYGFMQPAPCRVIASPKVTRWSYNITTTQFEINPGQESMAWEEGTRCIFLLSTKSSLTGNDLPQNGTEYSDRAGLTIGSSVFATVAESEAPYGSFVKNKSVGGLTPDTRYYLYAFPYNDTCSNFQYNTTNIPRIDLKTAMVAPASLQAEEASVSDTGYTLSVGKTGNNPYLLGVSTRQIAPGTLLNNRLHPKAGGYVKGDVITIGGEKIEVLAPCATDATYKVGGLSAGTERWYYAWSTRTDQSEYSYEPICRGFSTLRPVPSTVNFDAAAANVDINSSAAGGPAGWLFGEDNVDPFYVYNRAGLGNFLSVRMQRGDNGQVAHNTAVTPIFASGETRRVAAIFNLYFWRNGEITGDYPASAPNATDTLYIQYRLDGQDAWTTIATVTSAASVSGGALSVKTSSFETAGKNFRLRVLTASNHKPAARETTNYASIRSLSVFVPCNEVSALQVSDVMNSSALAKWEDVNNTPRAGSYAVAWNKIDASGAQQKANVLVREATLRGLAPHTPYVVSVRAVCGEGDTSAEQRVEFTTYRSLPYALKIAADGTIPEEITFRKGVLPTTGHAALQGVDAEKSVWEGAALPADSTRIALDFATADNPLWLRLPVLSVGNIRGKARFETKLSGTGSFNSADTIFVLLSSDSLFSRSEVLGMRELSSLNETENLDIEFEVTSPYLYMAMLANIGAAPGTETLFASGLKVEWTDIYCDPVKSLRQSHLTENSVDISWSGEGVEYAFLYREEGSEKWDTVFTRDITVHLDNLKSNTTYEYYVLTYCDEEREKVSDKSDTRDFTTLEECAVPTLEILKGTETEDGVVVVVLSPAPKKQLHIRPADLDECPYQIDVMDLQRDTTIVRGLTDCPAVTYYVKA